MTFLLACLFVGWVLRVLYRAGCEARLREENERLCAALELQALEAKLKADTEVDQYIRALEAELIADEEFDQDDELNSESLRLSGCA